MVKVSPGSKMAPAADIGVQLNMPGSKMPTALGIPSYAAT